MSEIEKIDGMPQYTLEAAIDNILNFCKTSYEMTEEEKSGADWQDGYDFLLEDSKRIAARCLELEKIAKGLVNELADAVEAREFYAVRLGSLTNAIERDEKNSGTQTDR